MEEKVRFYITYTDVKDWLRLVCKNLPYADVFLAQIKLAADELLDELHFYGTLDG